jgi:polyisoprenoid-binding protein YceI
MMEQNKPDQLAPETLLRWIAEKKDFFLIDTLTGDHFSKVHLPNSRNACVFEVSFIDQIKAITDDTAAEIVLYGSSDRSMDAHAAADKLTREGYGRVAVLAGGLEGWRSAGHPLEGEAADAPDNPQTVLSLEDRRYAVDIGRSTVQWTGRNPGTTHFGSINLAEGHLAVENGEVNGRFTIDMNSITNTNLEGDELQPVLIGHLKSDDFFFTTLFPTATFTIQRCTWVKPPYLSAPNCRLQGLFELRGVSADLEFMATVTPTAENELAAEAHFDIDRTKWNIVYGSTRFFEHLGMHLVFDLISLQVRLVAA